MTRPRASRYEMTEREEKVMKLGARRDTFTIGEIQQELNIPYTRAAAVAASLLEHGKLEISGREDRQYKLKLKAQQPARKTPVATPPPVEEPGLQEEAEVTQDEALMPEIKHLENVAVEDILTQLHIGLGGELKVTGFHIVEGKPPSIDLRTPDGETLNVAIISPSL